MNEKLKALTIGYVAFAAMGLLGLPMLAVEKLVIRVLGNLPEYAEFINDPATMAELESELSVLRWMIVILIVIHVVFNLLVAYSLKKRKFYWPCVFAGVLNLPAIPVGTLLGIFTIIVLRHREVRKAFGLVPVKTD